MSFRPYRIVDEPNKRKRDVVPTAFKAAAARAEVQLAQGVTSSGESEVQIPLGDGKQVTVAVSQKIAIRNLISPSPDILNYRNCEFIACVTREALDSAKLADRPIVLDLNTQTGFGAMAMLEQGFAQCQYSLARTARREFGPVPMRAIAGAWEVTLARFFGKERNRNITAAIDVRDSLAFYLFSEVCKPRLLPEMKNDVGGVAVTMDQRTIVSCLCGDGKVDHKEVEGKIFECCRQIGLAYDHEFRVDLARVMAKFDQLREDPGSALDRHILRECIAVLGNYNTASPSLDMTLLVESLQSEYQEMEKSESRLQPPSLISSTVVLSDYLLYQDAKQPADPYSLSATGPPSLNREQPYLGPISSSFLSGCFGMTRANVIISNVDWRTTFISWMAFLFNTRSIVSKPTQPTVVIWWMPKDGLRFCGWDPFRESKSRSRARQADFSSKEAEREQNRSYSRLWHTSGMAHVARPYGIDYDPSSGRIRIKEEPATQKAIMDHILEYKTELQVHRLTHSNFEFIFYTAESKSAGSGLGSAFREAVQKHQSRVALPIQIGQFYEGLAAAPTLYKRAHPAKFAERTVGRRLPAPLPEFRLPSLSENMLDLFRVAYLRTRDEGKERDQEMEFMTEFLLEAGIDDIARILMQKAAEFAFPPSLKIEEKRDLLFDVKEKMPDFSDWFDYPYYAGMLTGRFGKPLAMVFAGLVGAQAAGSTERNVAGHIGPLAASLEFMDDLKEKARILQSSVNANLAMNAMVQGLWKNDAKHLFQIVNDVSPGNVRCFDVDPGFGFTTSEFKGVTSLYTEHIGVSGSNSRCVAGFAHRVLTDAPSNSVFLKSWDALRFVLGLPEPGPSKKRFSVRFSDSRDGDTKVRVDNDDGRRLVYVNLNGTWIGQDSVYSARDIHLELFLKRVYEFLSSLILPLMAGANHSKRWPLMVSVCLPKMRTDVKLVGGTKHRNVYSASGTLPFESIQQRYVDLALGRERGNPSVLQNKAGNRLYWFIVPMEKSDVLFVSFDVQKFARSAGPGVSALSKDTDEKEKLAVPPSPLPAPFPASAPVYGDIKSNIRPDTKVDGLPVTSSSSPSSSPSPKHRERGPIAPSPLAYSRNARSASHWIDDPGTSKSKNSVGYFGGRHTSSSRGKGRGIGFHRKKRCS